MFVVSSSASRVTRRSYKVELPLPIDKEISAIDFISGSSSCNGCAFSCWGAAYGSIKG
jgi:hypothetical protein